MPYTAGTLKAEGLRGERVVAKSILSTMGAPAGLKLITDRAVLNADGQDLTFITVEAVDERGQLQMNSNQRVQLSVSGEGTIAAVGNGDGQSMDSYAGDSFLLFSGRGLVILRTNHTAGRIKLTTHADGLAASSTTCRKQGKAVIAADSISIAS